MTDFLGTVSPGGPLIPGSAEFTHVQTNSAVRMFGQLEVQIVSGVAAIAMTTSSAGDGPTQGQMVYVSPSTGATTNTFTADKMYVYTPTGWELITSV